MLSWLKNIDWRDIVGSAMVLMFLMAVTAPSSSVPDQHQTQNNGAQRTENAADNISRAEGANDRIATYTLWLSIFTFVLAVTSGFEIYLLVLAAKTANDTAIATGNLASAAAAQHSIMAAQQNITVNTQRAFVFLKEISATFDRPDAPPAGSIQAGLMARLGATHPSINTWRLSPVWENSGNTPTRRLVVNFTCRAIDILALDNFDFPYESKSERGFVGPKATMRGGGILLPATTLNQVAERDRVRLYVWGFADYDDIFENTPRRRTEFFFRVERVGVDSNGFPMLAFPLEPEHNAADEECRYTPAPFVET